MEIPAINDAINDEECAINMEDKELLPNVETLQLPMHFTFDHEIAAKVVLQQLLLLTI